VCFSAISPRATRSNSLQTGWRRPRRCRPRLAGLAVITNGSYVSFFSTFGIGALIVKGSDDANVYMKVSANNLIGVHVNVEWEKCDLQHAPSREKTDSIFNKDRQISSKTSRDSLGITVLKPPNLGSSTETPNDPSHRL
jgi:hypothetical protein